ncbi:MAG: hypothetical protein GF353_18835 [Candidatus Lokiarchaeota archaeon]|nr:hypothetical protein [Candidatus Lokiarchaeota archaeon]
MGNEPVITVSDTGPLLHLTEIACGELLYLFEKIFISPVVAEEFNRHNKDKSLNVLAYNNIHTMAVDQLDVQEFIADYELKDLHSGEVECLFICKKNSINLILTDDLAVRDIARKLEITAIGSLGVILRSYNNKFLNFHEAEKHILNLYEKSSLYVTKTIIDLVLEKLRKY